MTKEQLRQLIAEKMAEQAVQVTRYASPEFPNKIKTTVHRPVVNLKQMEWEEYLNQVKNGTYKPQSQEQYQVATTKPHQKANRRHV